MKKVLATLLAGALAASMLNLDFKKSVISVMLGVLLAGVIMLFGSYGIKAML